MPPLKAVCKIKNCDEFLTDLSDTLEDLVYVGTKKIMYE